MSPKKTLSTYRKKRKFNQTPEPAGKLKKITKRKKTTDQVTTFVVQKHDASHLHYDFRVHIGDVLTSWAVPKGPPQKIGDKRLAVQTEDHPLEYANFEGKIPEGNYGAGTVEIWDSGKAENIKSDLEKPEDLKTSLRHGHIELKLYGKRLKGNYALIKTPLAQKNSWLFIKIRSKKKGEK